MESLKVLANSYTKTEWEYRNFFQISDFTESLLFYERSPVGVKKGSSQEIESLKTIIDLIFWIVTILRPAFK